MLCLVAYALCALSAVAQAVEPKRTFRLLDSAGSQVGSYNTQSEAVAAIKALPSPIPIMPDAYTHVTEIKESSVDESGAITITYWMPRNQPTDPDWTYDGSFATEAEAVADRKARYSNPGCSAAQFVPTGPWAASFPEYAGVFELRPYLLTTHVGSPDCTPHSSQSEMGRQRRLMCQNPYTRWSNTYNACVNEEITATITTKTEECPADTGAPSGLVGNPCDVKTGGKFETETDFDLGWVALTRYYHSGLMVEQGDLGLNWSHQHRMKLLLAAGKVALQGSAGYQTPFKLVGSTYQATDGSGDRIVASGTQWLLYQAGTLSIFDAKGLLLSRRASDGATLAYAYDAKSRLAKITGQTGRSVTFQYAGDSPNITAVLSNGIALATYAYDVQGRLTKVTYGDAKTRIYHYEDARFPNHLTGITNENAQRYSTFAYDAQGRVISSQHAAGADKVTLSYTTTGTVVTDALGKQTTYTLVDAGGGSPKIGSVKDSSGTATFSYNDQAADFRRRLHTAVDKNGTQTKFAYSELTDPVTNLAVQARTTQEAFGLAAQRTTEERWNKASGQLVMRKVGNQETRYAYNARFQPMSVTIKDVVSGVTRTTTMTYCEQADVTAGTCPLLGLMTRLDGPRTDAADITTYSYYPSDDASCATAPATCPRRKGDLWKTTNALGQVSEILKYDGAGRVLSVKDPNGVVTDFEYHVRGWLTARKVRGADNAVETDDQITRITYYPNGLVQKLTQPDGSFVQSTYDAAQRLTGISDNAGNRMTYTVDNAGNRTKEDTKDSAGILKRTLSRIYNQSGQLASQSDAYSKATGFSYDADDNPNIVTDALGRKTDNDYDPLNRLSRVLQDTAGINAETKFSYDALDQLTQVTDPKGLATIYTINALGDLTKQTSSDTGVTTYTTDSAGNRKTQLDARGITATYSYDALNRLTGIGYPTASQNVSYSYDTVPAACPAGEQAHKGRLSSMTDASGSTVYCYDRFGQRVRKVQITHGHTFTVRYLYTAGGRLRETIYPDGAKVDYVRNALGQITEAGLTNAGGTRQVIVKAITYAPFGPATGWTLGNGRVLTRTHNLNYQPQSIRDAAAGGLDLAFQYDAVGNLALFKTAAGINQAQYGYDALNRLTHAKDGPTGTPIETYGYDKTGNRTSLLKAGVTTPYTYPATSHRLGSMGSTVHTYDPAGNTASIGGNAREFVYNNANRLAQVKRLGVVKRDYLYNGKGEQVRSYAGTSNTYTVFDEAGHWLGDYGAPTSPVQQAIWLDDLPIGLLTGAGASQTVQYLQPDHLGSPRVAIDAVANTAIWRWDLKGEAFGNTPPNQDPDGNGQAFVLNLRYPGQRFDAATGLNYNYFRDYDPGTGRYVQSDPIGLKGGISTYAYVGGNPVAWVDPMGLCSCGLPSAATFMSNYPDYNSYTGSGVWSLIGGSLEANYGANSPGGTQNSCAARVSYGLNASGKPIPAGAPGANRNWGGDNNRYIISAQQMNNYLSGAYGPPSQTISNASQLATLREGLGAGGAAIVSSGGHASVVTSDYADPYVSAYLGDVWVLPGGNCSCP